MSRNRWMEVLLLWLLLSQASHGAAPVDYGPKYLAPSDEVKSPAIQWLKPSTHGKLKVLFITYRGGMREVVELGERMDLDYQVFATANVNLYYPDLSSCGSAYESSPSNFTLEDAGKRWIRLLDQDYDLIVCGNIDWNVLPLKMRYRILQKVKEGTGFVGFLAKEDTYLRRAMAEKIDPPPGFLFPFKGLPAFKKHRDIASLLAATVETAQFGEGRIILLKGYTVPMFQALTPAAEGNPLEIKRVEYDYYLAYICRFMLFAANREPGFRIGGKDYVCLDRAALRPLDFSVSGPSKQELDAVAALRNKDNEIITTYTQKVDVISGKAILDFKINKVSAGNYFADIWLKQGSNILDFGSTYIEITSDSYIEAIKMHKVYLQEEDMKGSVSVRTKRGDVRNFNLEIIRRDIFGRITGRQTVPVAEIQSNGVRNVEFCLPAVQPLSIIQYLNVNLRQGTEILDRKRETFSISNINPSDDIRYLLWVTPYVGYSACTFFDEIARAGFDTQYGAQPREFSEAPFLANLRHMPYCPDDMFFPRGKQNYTKSDHIRVPCLNDPKERKKLNEQLTGVVRKEKPFSVLEYSMGDELGFVLYSSTVEKCFCRYCVAGFHQFLREEYGSLDKVNLEYNAKYVSFEDIQPVTIADVKKDNALTPLWVDYRRYMENCWAEIFKYSGDIIQETVPGAKIGYEGSDTWLNSYRAADYDKIMQNIKINNTYDGAFIPYTVKDFSRPGTMVGLGWYGGYNANHSPEFQRYIAWRHLFRGANSFWVWYANPSGLGGSVMTPDFSFYDYFKTNIQEIREIKRGIGKMLMNARRDNEGIAVLYSPASVHVATLTDKAFSMEQVLNSLTPLLEDVRCPFKLISARQLCEGILDAGKIRLLIMPYTQALSRKEAQIIRDFVNRGGTIIADLRPGVCDEHGKPYEQGALDDIFGVFQNTREADFRAGTVIVREGGFPGQLPQTTADASLKTVNGRIGALIDNTPCLIMNSYGRGQTVLLNFLLAGYRITSSLEVANGVMTAELSLFQNFTRTLLTKLGFRERVKLMPEIPGLRIYQFSSGNLEYLALLQELPEGNINYATGKAKPLAQSSTKIMLGEKYHIYNVRKGVYLCYTNIMDVRVEPGRAELYSLLPYRIEKITIILPVQISQGMVMEYEVKLKKNDKSKFGSHVIHTVVRSPQGDELPYYSENLVADDGTVKGKVPLALNAAMGEWAIIVTDVATGVACEQSFMVREEK